MKRFFGKPAHGEASRPPTEMVFTIRVHDVEPDDGGGYWGEVLELEGCVSQGETLDELTANVKEAILAWLSANAQDDAANKPKPGLTITVPVLVPATDS